MRNIEVSIYCLAYNHERYIAQTIESIISQKTDFEFQLIIHDDASSDKTTTIIAEYAQKYPNVIVPIFQKENQYSQGISIIKNYIYPRIEGEYIAICEGDDYWSDNNKLQIQYAFLSNNQDYSAVCHAAKKINAVTGKEIAEIRPFDCDTDCDMVDAIHGLGSSVATNSCFFRKSVYQEMFRLREKLPRTGVGDYLLLVAAANCGKIRYMDSEMSVYRYGVPGSWTTKMKKSGKTTKERFLRKREYFLEALEEYIDKSFSDAIQDKLKDTRFEICLLNGNIKEVFSRYKSEYKQLSKKNKLKLYVRAIGRFFSTFKRGSNARN